MKEKISFVAVGQAGGNIGRLFEQEGYPVLYINTSKEDLDTLKDIKFRYHITGGEGCNKDRNKAKQLLMEDYDQIAAEIDTKIEAELIIVLFASGGGTGSGAGPMLIDLLLDDGHAVGAATIIPAANESIKSNINAYECFTELTALDKMGACFILDNKKGEKLDLNRKFTQSLCTFLELPEKHRDVSGIVDKAEAMETLKAHGMAIALSMPAKESTGVLHAFKENIYAELEADRVVKYIAVSLAEETNMEDIVKVIGMPVDIFQTSNNNETICCLSGLSYPQARLEEIYRCVQKNQETVKRNLAATKETPLKQDVNFLESLEIRGKMKKQQSKREIMGKYLKK